MSEDTTLYRCDSYMAKWCPLEELSLGCPHFDWHRYNPNNCDTMPKCLGLDTKYHNVKCKPHLSEPVQMDFESLKNE